MLDAHFSRPPTEETQSHSTLCRVPCLMTAVAPEDQPLCGQKRRRGAIEERSTTATSQPPWKKAKRRRQSQQETNTAYWDSLSKLWLTRRALNELNRRNRQKASPVCSIDLMTDEIRMSLCPSLLAFDSGWDTT